LPRDRHPLKVANQQEATLKKIASDPGLQAMVDVVQASIEPGLPSLKAVIFTQNKPLTSVQVEWQVTVQLIKIVYGGCFLLLLFKGIELIRGKKENFDAVFSLILMMPASLICINLLSLVALVSTYLAAVAFLDIIIFLISLGIANSVESLVFQPSDRPLKANNPHLTRR